MADQHRELAAQRAGIIAKAPEIYKLKNSFNSWLKQFRNYSELVNVPDANMYRTFMCFMDEECFSVIEGLNLTNAQKLAFFDNATQTLIKTAIKNRQGARVPAEFMLRFRKQEENESIEKYASALEKIALEAFPEEQNIRQNRQLIQSFLMGVRNDELGVKLLEENFDNLTDAINAATQYFKALQTRRFIKKDGDSRNVLEKVYQIEEQCANCRSKAETVNATSQQTVIQAQGVQQGNLANITAQVPNQIPQMMQSLPQQPNVQVQNSAQLQYPQSGMMNQYGQFPQPMYQIPNQRQQYPAYNSGHNSNRNRRANIQCYACKKYGHYKSECKMIQNQRSNYDRRYCTYCSKFGHVAAQCFHLNPRENNDTQKVSNVSKNPFRPL
jgi:hypothetical protein